MSKNDFVLSEFLTDVFIYAVAKTDNLVESAFTKSIKKDFYTAYNPVSYTHLDVYKRQVTDGLQGHPAVGFNDHLVVDMHDDGTAAKGLHGVTKDIS